MPSTIQLLRDLLLTGSARTQSEIQHAFARKQVRISQSNISRLLHQIGAVKVTDAKGKTQYKLPHETGLIHELSSIEGKSLIRQWVLEVAANEHLIVVHSTPGSAAMVARIIDKNRSALAVLGTLAGDDTVFIAPKVVGEIKMVQKKIAALFNL